MKSFIVDVEYDAIVMETTVVNAHNWEEAKQKILNGYIEDAVDMEIEKLEITNFNLINEDEIKE